MWSFSWGDTWTGRDWPDTLERPGVGRIDTFLIHRRPPDRLVESDFDVRIGLGPRSDVGDRDVQFEGSCGRPFAVGGDEFVSRVFDRGCDHERIRKPKFAVPRAKGCRGVSDPSIEIRNLDRQPFDEVVDHGDGTRSSTLRADETLSESGRGHGESITAAKHTGERRARGLVVCVVGIEEADDDTRVEVDQSHSSRRVSTPCRA